MKSFSELYNIIEKELSDLSYPSNSKDLYNAIDRSIDLTDNTFAEEYAFPI